MEPQGRRRISPFRATKRSTKLRRLSKTTRLRVHVQTVGLNAETKKVSAPADGEECLLTFPFIGLVRFARLPTVTSLFAICPKAMPSLPDESVVNDPYNLSLRVGILRVTEALPSSSCFKLGIPSSHSSGSHSAARPFPLPGASQQQRGWKAHSSSRPRGLFGFAEPSG